MNKRLTALLLALALILSVGMVSALADEETAPAEENAAAAEETAGGEETAGEETSETEGETADDPAAETPAVDEAPVIEIEEATPNMIMFAELDDLVRKNSPAYKAVRANAAAIDDAQSTVNSLQGSLVQIEAELKKTDASIKELNEKDSLTEEEEQELLQLSATKTALQKQQKDAQSGISGLSSMAGQSTAQLDGGANQIIMGCETVYITLVDLKLQEASLERQLASLDRTLAMMRVRQEWGQVSPLQVKQLESSRETLVGGLATLRMNRDSLRMQLEYMLGEDITGTAEVGTLPRVTAEELDAIDLEKDLKMVLRRNPEVQAAEDQEDSLYTSGMMGLGDVWDSMSDAADYGVKSAKLQAEMKFRSLYLKLQDNRQAVATARNALEVEQLTYDAAVLKYERGAISHNELLDAEDALQTAKESVVKAENTLFSTYNAYNWAVKHGILS